jgi:hypothetical protein
LSANNSESHKEKLSAVDRIYRDAVQMAEDRFHVRFKESSSIKQIIDYVTRQNPQGSDVALFSSILTTAESCFYGAPAQIDANIADMQESIEALRKMWQDSDGKPKEIPAKRALPIGTPPAPVSDAQDAATAQENLEAKSKPTVEGKPKGLQWKGFSGIPIPLVIAYVVLAFSIIYVAYSFVFFEVFHYYGSVVSYFPWSLTQRYTKYGGVLSQFYAGIIVSDTLLAVSASMVLHFERQLGRGVLSDLYSRVARKTPTS